MRFMQKKKKKNWNLKIETIILLIVSIARMQARPSSVLTFRSASNLGRW